MSKYRIVKRNVCYNLTEYCIQKKCLIGWKWLTPYNSDYILKKFYFDFDSAQNALLEYQKYKKGNEIVCEFEDKASNDPIKYGIIVMTIVCVLGIISSLITKNWASSMWALSCLIWVYMYYDLYKSQS